MFPFCLDVFVVHVWEGLTAHGITESSECQQQVCPKKKARGKSCVVISKTL